MKTKVTHCDSLLHVFALPLGKLEHYSKFPVCARAFPFREGTKRICPVCFSTCPLFAFVYMSIHAWQATSANTFPGFVLLHATEVVHATAQNQRRRTLSDCQLKLTASEALHHDHGETAAGLIKPDDICKQSSASPLNTVECVVWTRRHLHQTAPFAAQHHCNPIMPYV